MKNREVIERMTEIVHAVVGGSEVTAEVEETAGNLTGEWLRKFGKEKLGVGAFYLYELSKRQCGLK